MYPNEGVILITYYTYNSLFFLCYNILLLHVGSIILLNNFVLNLLCRLFQFAYLLERYVSLPYAVTGLIKVLYNLNSVDWLTNLLFKTLFKACSVPSYFFFTSYFSLKSSLIVGAIPMLIVSNMPLFFHNTISLLCEAKINSIMWF